MKKKYRSRARNVIIGLDKLFARTEIGECIRFPKISFKDHELVLKKGLTYKYKGNEFPHESIMALLDEHPGNTKNGGNTFFEETGLPLRTFSGQFGFVEPEDWPTKEDEEKIKALKRYAESISPPQKDIVVDTINYMYERLQISNYKKPSKLMNIRRLKSWIDLFVAQLEEEKLV